MEKKVRVRFAPSPTGGLHLGGVRTVLFNYLFAKQHGGDFIVRIEDTDQTRFVEGAEAYIFETLAWCGLTPDESPLHGGPFAPYRQSERKPMYKQYADQLIQEGKAYYAFDTAEELDAKRKEINNFQYSQATRGMMKNSLTLDPQAVEQLLADGTPYVIRIKLPENEEVKFTDMIRGEVVFNTSQVDDKVLLKADGMPTYHLAVVVDDYKMEITHAFRGEEWLPSAPVHVLLWSYLFGIDNMPKWAHLPLILKPDGNGKLSKRDGDRLGFPTFAMDWSDPKSGETTIGFRERGFLPEAFVNMLAALGWNDGTGQELFTLEELIEKFSIGRVHKGGAKFDYEKAKWYNQEWIKKMHVASYQHLVAGFFKANGIEVEINEKFTQILEMVKERCVLLSDFVAQASFFLTQPETIDIAAISPKWDEKKQMFFVELIRAYELSTLWEASDLEKEFKELAAAHQLKPGELMLPFRIMLVGGKFGPGVFEIAAILGKEETVSRIKSVLGML
ncbi:glutamate--tRNA ligase [Parasediminibacterium sp. JCM 36343]|uniref:glutamate--tRNA ligase n=1 Tax=Parasediminibacterium sp. JCM 36343 TaxID=3374279 RepID=UPI00397DE2B3